MTIAGRCLCAGALILAAAGDPIAQRDGGGFHLGETAALAATPAPPEVLRYERGRLTLHAAGVSLAGVLEAIARVSGAALRGTLPSDDVTATLDDVPLADALTTVLHGRSFMLVYDGGGALRVIELLEAAPAVASSPEPPTLPIAATSSPSSGTLAEEEAQAAVLQRPVAISGTLARALGDEQITTGRLLYAATNEPQSAVRAEAREALLATFAADPAREAAYLSTLTPVANDVLARILRGSEQDGGAQELMAELASRSRSPELRAKAAAVLQELQRQR